MSYEELSDDTALTVDTKQPDNTATSIRRSIASVESSLSEFDKIVAGLADLQQRYPVDLVYDVSTTKGMAEAVAHRAAWRDPRIATEKFRKTAKQPLLTLGKDIDARAAWITEQLLAGETPVHEQIKAEEARKAKERADREAAEFGRILAMQEAVGEIAMAAMVNGLGSEGIAARLEALRTEALDPKVFQEMMPQAEAARAAAITKLEQAVKAAQWDEAQAKARADEAERARVAHAHADAERARVSAAQAEEEKRLKEARDMIEKAQRDFDEKLAAERAVIAAERAAWLAEQEAAKPKAAEPTIAAEKPVITVELDDTPAFVPPVDAIPTLKLGTICERLGFQLRGDFIEVTLGILGSRLLSGSRVLWHEEDFPAICDALIKHIKAVTSA